MTETTALDAAHRAMTDRPEEDAARLAFYQALADSALVLLMEESGTEGAEVTPRVFSTGEGDFVLAFDDEARLAAFGGGGPSAYAALSGRQLVQALDGRGVGIGLNFGAPSEILLPAAAVDWLRGMLDAAPVRLDAAPLRLAPPDGVAPALLAALDAKLGRAAGLAEAAWLCRAEAADGARPLLLVLVGSAPGAEAALAKAAGEALIFGGAEAETLDVAFAAPGDALLARLSAVGLRFDLPDPAATAPRAAPGSDPDRPPRLR